MIFEATVTITLKEGVLDTAGKAVRLSLEHLGHTNIEELRIGKVVLLRLDAENEKTARDTVEALCSELLVNQIIEEYRYALEKK